MKKTFQKFTKQYQKNFKFKEKKEEEEINEKSGKKKKLELNPQRMDEVVDLQGVNFFDEVDENVIYSEAPCKQTNFEKKKRKRARKLPEPEELTTNEIDQYVSDPEPDPRPIRKRNKRKKFIDDEAEEERDANDKPWDISADYLGELSDDNNLENYKNRKHDKQKDKLRKAIELDMDDIEQQEKQRKRKGKGTKKEDKKPGEKKRRKRKNVDPELIVELYDENLVAFKFLGFYNEDMKNSIKNRKNTCYDSERKLWVVTIKDYKDILDDVKDYLNKEHAKFQDIPKFAVDLMKNDVPIIQYFEGGAMKHDYTKDSNVSL